MLGPDSDRVIDALAAVEEAVETSVEHLIAAASRLRELRHQREAGMTYREIVEQVPRPLLVESISLAIAPLQHAGFRLRSAEARALHDEGLTMEEIAVLFGVSRQRVSALLRSSG